MYYQRAFKETFARVPHCHEVKKAFDDVINEFQRLINLTDEDGKRRIHRQL